MRPWEGSALCAGLTRARRPCCNLVVIGFGHCLHHVPPGQLDQAEAVAGFRLCRRDPDCRQFAISWSDPPGCKNHLSGLARQLEYRQHVRYLIEVRRAELMSAWFAYQDGDRSAETLRLLSLDA